MTGLLSRSKGLAGRSSPAVSHGHAHIPAKPQLAALVPKPDWDHRP